MGRKEAFLTYVEIASINFQAFHEHYEQLFRKEKNIFRVKEMNIYNSFQLEEKRLKSFF